MLLLLGILLLLLLRKKLLVFFESLNSCIDDIMNEKSDVKFNLESEILTSKFNFKLKRLYSIMQQNSNQTKKEKNHSGNDL